MVKPRKNNTEDIDSLRSQLAELQKTEQQYKQLVEASPEAVAVHAKGTLLYVNKAAVKLMGARSSSELLHKSIMQFVHPDFHEVVKKRVADLYQNRMPSEPLEEKFLRVDGKPIDVEVISMPIVYQGQQAVQIAVRNITYRKKIENQLLIHSHIAESISDAVIVMDKGFTIISWNKGAERLYGWSEKDVLGKKTMDVIPHVYLTSSKEEFLKEIVNGSWRGQVIQYTKKGKKLIVVASTSLVTDKNKNTIGYVTINRDISDELISQSRLAAIVESSDDAIASKSLDGVIKTWNKAAEKMFGYTAEEAIGQNVLFIIPPELQKEEKEIIRQLKKGNRIHHFETVRVGKSGKRINVSLSISPIKNSAGEVIGASKIARDISDRKKTEIALKESEERLRMALEAGRIGVWDWDMGTDNLYWTDNVYKIHGVDKKSFKPTLKHYLKLIHPDDKKGFDDAIQRAIKEKKPFNHDMRIMGLDGIHWITTSAIVFYDSKGKPTRMLGATSDITKQKQLDQEKSDFLSMASHELKTPLTSMKIFIDLLKRQQNLVPEKGGYYIDRIKDQADRLAELTNDLLDVSRIETGKLKLNKDIFELNTFVEETIESIQPSTRKHEITMYHNGPVEVVADKYRIYQVLINLLTNAIKYSPKSEKILVKVDSRKNDVVVSVKDFGIGIKKEEQAKIFDRLYQVCDPEEKTYPGLGLGLFISKEIMDRHQGKIWVESKKGEGSTFFFSLPK